MQKLNQGREELRLEIILGIIVAAAIIVATIIMTIAAFTPVYGQHACQDINRISECIGIIEGMTGQELDPTVAPPLTTSNTTIPIPPTPEPKSSPSPSPVNETREKEFLENSEIGRLLARDREAGGPGLGFFSPP